MSKPVIDEAEKKRAAVVRMPVHFSIDCTFHINELNEVLTQEITGVKMGLQKTALEKLSPAQRKYLDAWAEREAPGLAIILAKEIIHNASDVAQNYHVEKALKENAQRAVDEANKGMVNHATTERPGTEIDDAPGKDRG